MTEFDPRVCWYVEDELGGMHGPTDEDEARALAHEMGGSARCDEERAAEYYWELERERRAFRE